MRKLSRILPIIAAMVLLLVVVSVVHAEAAVSSVAITSNPGTDNNYARGDTITVTLTFSEAVTVTGTPYVVLDIGGQPRHAAYSGDGSSMTAQPFSYTVLVGDRDTDGVSLEANSLTLSGGAIQTTSDSTDATLTHAAMTFANHNVDNDITLVSNIDQTAATDHITISATQSATVSFVAAKVAGSTVGLYTLKEIALDVQTASPTLDVTITVSGERVLTDYVFSGPVATTGTQVFTFGQTYIRHAELRAAALSGFTYEVTIAGSGSGTVEIGATASDGQDTGGLTRWAIADPPTNETVPRLSLRGHEHANPFITHAEIISAPEDGTSYRAGEQIAVLFVFSGALIGTFPATADLWLGAGAAQRREASLAAQYPQSDYHHAVYAYTVQSGDSDTDGILLGENPLGRNADFALARRPPLFGVTAPYVPVDLTLPSMQLGAGHLVDGSQQRTCEEVACLELTVEDGVGIFDHSSGFQMLSDGLPFEYRGALSQQTFSYKDTAFSIFRVDLIEPVDPLTFCGDTCEDITDPFLLVGIDPEIVSFADRLGFEVDGVAFHISEADTGSGGISFWWTNPGLEWSDGDTVQIKLIENATASFDMANYTANEGDSFDVTVTLSDSFENTRTLPVVVTPNGGATEADYSISPQELVFAPGETEKTFSVTLVDDTSNDDDETLTLSIDEPHIKSGGTNDTATVNITDNDDPVGCESGDLWCATVVYSGSAASNASKPSGRKLLIWGSGGGDMFQFAYKGNTYEVLSGTLGPNPGGGTYVRPPFHIPERSKALLSVFHYRPEERQTRWEVPNQDDLDDWTLYISTGTGDDFVEARLPLDEAKFCCGHSWRWHGLDLYHLNDAWTATKEYRLRIVLDLSADRTPEVLGPPLHLRTPGATRHNALVHWVRPQMRNDAAPPGVSYKVQWKAFNNSWDVPAAVSHHVYQPPAGKETLSFRISGLTPGSAYDVRVIAVNAVGDSAPSNVLRVNTDQPLPDPQNQAANSPATGGPGIIGTVRAGETLTATTDGIEDEDGLEGADFSYQWVRQDLATFDDTDIEGATGSTYTVTDDDEGKAIKVRVTFTDDAGNEESLTSYARLSAPLLVIPDEEETPESSEARETAETPLTATIHDAPESHDGQTDFTFELRFSEEPKEDFSYKTLKDHAFTVTGGEVDGVRRLEKGKNIRWQIRVEPGSSGDVTVVLPATTDCEADGAICTDDGRMLSEELELTVSGPDSQQQAANTPATGEPAISGTARVGETLTADTSGIADEDGLTNVSYSYQWVADDTDIDGATDSSYTLSEDDVGKTINVRVSFEDDAGNEESLTSAATAAAARPSLTGSVLNAPQSHNGSDDFTFRITFSEELETDFSFTTLKDHAFTVTGGEVDGARRLVRGSNIRWEITVSPDSNGDVTVKLPATEDCGAQGAICTEDGRMLSEGLEFTVSGPGQ